MNSSMVNKVPSKWGLLIAIFFIVSIIFCLFLGLPLFIGIGITLFFTLGVLRFHSVPLGEGFSLVYQGIKSGKNIYGLILLIGLNVSMWISSGIVPTLIYYGLDLVHRVNYLPLAFIISAVLAFFLGTGLGTISTIGIALLTLGESINIPSSILVGALISGAYIADRLSPISALVNFTLETVGVSFKSYFKKVVKVMIPSFFIAIIFYTILGLQQSGTLSSDDVLYYKEAILDAFFISPFLIIMPIVVLIISFIGVKSSGVLGFGIVSGFFISLVFQEATLYEGIKFLFFGFETSSKEAFIQTLEIGGGLPMLEVVLVVMGGIALSRLYEEFGWIYLITDFVNEKNKSSRHTIGNTGFLSIFLNALTCDQTVGILLPGKYLKETYYSNGMSDEDLAQTIANSGTALAPLMPWNVNAIIIFAITGVSALHYAPFAILNWIAFPIAVFLTNNISSKDIKKF
ncbi:MAG: hypothetical protein JJT76_12140 [Clostridiaceae bacterium]|nr:hypothetical protein [Clostridiaceae bacterium]